MNFDFLQKKFPDCKVILKDIGYGTFAEVYAADEAEPVKVFYEGDDPQPYTVAFAFQHIHCNEAEAVGYIGKLLSGEKSAIEFFVGDHPIVGGDIDSIAPEDFTEDYFKTCPFAAYILSRPIRFGLHFKVRSVLKKFCFDGRIEKTGEKINFVIKPIT